MAHTINKPIGRRFLQSVLCSILWSILLQFNITHAIDKATWHPYIGGGIGMQSSYAPTFCVAGSCQGDTLPIGLYYSGFIGIEKEVSKIINVGLEYQYATSKDTVQNNTYHYQHNNINILAQYHIKKNIGVGVHIGMAINNLRMSTENAETWKSGNTTSGLFGANVEYYPIENIGIALRYNYYLGYQTSFIMPNTGFIGNVNVGGISTLLATIRLLF